MLLFIKQFPLNLALSNGQELIKNGAKLWSDPGVFLIISSGISLDFHEKCFWVSLNNLMYLLADIKTK